MSARGFAWRLSRGGAEPGHSEAFPDRASAEVWMGERWPGLQEQGITEVELIDLDTSVAVYSMSLEPE